MTNELVMVLDCRDLVAQADFWSAALGYQQQAIAEPYCSLLPPDGNGFELLLQRVPEYKVGKNRMHLDIRLPAGQLDDEVRRLTGHGASLVNAAPMVELGWRWYVLADPEGNEFCILERPAQPPVRRAVLAGD